ncbi:ADP-ribosylglycohydrolase family protein [bacterium]|nr:ADP-ribosylglycohydrolase family protein [bacterium]
MLISNNNLLQYKLNFGKKDNLNKHNIDNYEGCVIGGAIGDALGNPVEFDRLSTIKRIYGKNGITDLETVNGKALITDDTQMTIYTADGLIKSAIKEFDENKIPDMKQVYSSYRDWLNTQYGHFSGNEKGWINNIKELYAMRAPGTTCTGSLRANIPGSIENHINSSKGCGGVMRVAPAGLMYYKNLKLAFETGARCAALTHGSPSAYLPAGVHACIIANLVNGENIEDSVNNSIEVLKTYKGHEDTLELLEMAKKYAKSDIDSETAIKNLGEGWHGDEAIAISVYCALKSPEDYKNAVIMAVNHDGDSDSTGAITGNIVGTYLGKKSIPNKWLNTVEIAKELGMLSQDLYSKPEDIPNANKRYFMA